MFGLQQFFIPLHQRTRFRAGLKARASLVVHKNIFGNRLLPPRLAQAQAEVKIFVIAQPKSRVESAELFPGIGTDGDTEKVTPVGRHQMTAWVGV